MNADWHGVYPALMTEFRDDESLDLDGTAAHIEKVLAAGADGFVMLGTLGETTSLTADEKRAVLETAIETVDGRVPVLVGCAEYTTPQAVDFVRDAARLGAAGSMVLPPMVYKTDPAETLHHFRTVARSSGIPLMIYNNPVSYGTDVTPEMFAELADEPAIVAIKESSDDVRRLTDIVNLVGDRYTLFCGVDDIALEAVVLGAEGWIAGLVNAFPVETVQLYKLTKAGRLDEARELYRWFMPLLHLDCHSKLVQYIKLANQMTGMGSEMVRSPRLMLEGKERAQIQTIIKTALDARPKLAAE